MAWQLVRSGPRRSVQAVAPAKPGLLISAFLLLCASAAATPSSVFAQATLREANAFIAKGHESLRFGAEKQRAGDLSEAMLAFEMAKNNASRALKAGARLRVPFESRPAGLFFLAGQSFLSLAQLRIETGEPENDVDDNLFQAERFFRDALRLTEFQHPEGSAERAERRAEVGFAIGSVLFIRGNLISARLAMTDILELNAQNSEAKALLDTIDYLQGRRLGRPVSASLAIPAPPSEVVSGNWAMTYAVQVGKALFGRWGTLDGKLATDAFVPRRPLPDE